MKMRYDPEIVDQFEDTTDPMAQAVRQLVDDGLLGYVVESDGEGGFRLRYFAINRSDPFWSRASAPGIPSDDEPAVDALALYMPTPPMA